METMINAGHADIVLWCQLMLAIFHAVWRQKLRHTFGSIQRHQLYNHQWVLYEMLCWMDILQPTFGLNKHFRMSQTTFHQCDNWNLTDYNLHKILQFSVSMSHSLFQPPSKILKSSGSSSHSPNQILAVSLLYVTLANAFSVCPIM